MARSTGTWNLGGYQTGFSRNFHTDGRDVAALTAQVIERARASAKVDAAATDVIPVANAFREMFAALIGGRTSARGLRGAHAVGRRQSGQRGRRGVSGRGRPDLRHLQFGPSIVTTASFVVRAARST